MRAPRRITTAPTQPSRLLIAIAALSLLAMPMDYRGGADVTHAHAFFQFWGADAADAADHHHDGAAHDSTPTGHPELAKDLSSNNAALLAKSLGTFFPAVGNAFINTAPDVPTVSEMTATAELGSGIAVSIAALIALLTLAGTTPIGTRARSLFGQSPSPESPPPRGGALAH